MKFIVFEGLDGCGKSTHAKLLSHWLTQSGKKVHLTREPTGDTIGKTIRQVLSGKVKVSPYTLALLFTADRAEHVKEIKQQLKEGQYVICDRYYYSTIAYQSAQGVDRDILEKIQEFAPKPDLVFYLKVDPEKAAARTSTGEIFEKSQFLKKVQVEYEKFKDMVVVDTSGEVEEVQAEIRSRLESLI